VEKSNSIFEPINSVLRDYLEAIQIPARIAAIKSFNSGYVFHYPQLNTNPSSYHITPGYYGKPFVPLFTESQLISVANTKSPSFVAPPAIDSQENRKEELAGFSARVCENCGEVFVEAQYEAEESGNDPIIITKNGHICLSPLKSLSADEMGRRIASLAAKLTWLPWALKNKVKEWTGQDTFLVAFKIPFDKVKRKHIVDIFVSPRKINNYKRNDNHHPNLDSKELLNGWALRVRENGSINLSDNDLVTFIMIARNKTSGYFRIHFDALEVNKDKTNSNTEIYCMFINNRPLHGLVVR
jgi:hypothetical protein